ncbi:MAG: metallophosphoesterase [Chryseobacterium sp.]
MRVIQLSDIHLNKENLTSLKDYYIEALIKDLVSFNSEKQIDLILITGDLVDKGGASFGIENPYLIFETEFIDKLKATLKINTGQILMIPGNHDIERDKIKEENEFFLTEKLTSDIANVRSDKFREEFNEDNERIRRFKEFEKEFHKNTIDYEYSNNESLCIYEKDGVKLGIALINDSWRCSASLKKEQHFIGYRQLFRAQNKFKTYPTNMNIAVFHHPLNAINENEKDEINSILKSKDFDIAIFGHSHRHEAEQLSSANGGYLSINGRSAFSDPKELSSRYQPGYNILDIDILERKYTLHTRKYISARFEFDNDTDSLPGGYESNQLPVKERLYPLAQDSNNADKDLPGSFTADVDKIVSLLIGESIYPDKYAFVRELIQNSVDACNRIKEKYSHLTPRIIINIDTVGNYIEFIDEGDGMSKNVLKNHFAVLGKSISQEYNDNNGRSNLISKFGIGFISTFIAAEKVLINTKSEENEQIIFEIENVFKGFKYIQVSSKDQRESTGTTIRVYLKKGFDTRIAYSYIGSYCRHIVNFEINYDGSNTKLEERWNIESSIYSYINKNNQYEARLAIGLANRGIIASYCGFLISTHPYQVIPEMFPIHISGEINFYPKSIDFDISRTNIIPTSKADDCRKEISTSLRKLFREILESKNLAMYEQVVNYLHCYLQHYDGTIATLENHYNDFYSKRELMSLCAEHTLLEYNRVELSLAGILAILRAKSINCFYVHDTRIMTDYEAVVIEYLTSKGNLIILPKNTPVNFLATQQYTTNLTVVVQIIANEYGIYMQNIKDITPDSLSEMKLDKKEFPEKLQIQISNIEKNYLVSINIGKFSASKKASISHANQIFINYYHEAFKSLLEKLDEMTDDTLRIYLLGLLGLKLSGSITLLENE